MEKQYKKIKVFRTFKMPKEVYKELKLKELGEGNEYRALPSYFSFNMNDEWDIVEVVGKNKFANEHYFDETTIATFTPEYKEQHSPIVCLDKLTGTEILKDVVDSGLRKVIQRGQCIVSDWLFDNGAEIHEEIIIWDM